MDVKSALPKRTMAIDVRDRIRSDILSARLRPGQRLMFADLSSRYGASVGVTREALTWLTSQGLVETSAHQGYRVKPLSIPDMQELTDARVLIEPLVLRRSFEIGGTGWEAAVMAAHHVLSRTPPPDADKPLDQEQLDRWAEAHSAFHEVLVSACPNKRLVRIVRHLAEEAAIYRRWSVSLAHYDPQSISEHRILLDSALAGDWKRGGEILRTHYLHTQRNLTEYVASHPNEQA